MAHQIEDNRAFFVGEKAWHNLGTVLNTAPNYDEAIHLLTRGDVYLKADLKLSVDGFDMPLEKSKVIIRTDGKSYIKEFKTVGADFELLQPYEQFKPYQGLIDSGLLTLEAGGLLYEGSQAWLLGKINNSETEITKNDTIKAHFLMFTGFDGSKSLGAIDCNKRVVCNNTLQVAKREEGRNISFSHKHTKNIRHKIDNIEQVVSKRLQDFKEECEAYKFLAEKRMAYAEQVNYIAHVILTPEELRKPETVSEKKKTIVQNVIDLLDTQKGLELVPAIRGTAWHAYNAVTDYVTHSYGKSESSRFTAQFFGESAKIGQKALDMALAM